MSSGIIGTSYPILYTFALLQQTSITIDNLETVTITNGQYGNVPAGPGSISGVQATTVATQTATNQLGNVTSGTGTLVRDIINYTSTLQSVTLSYFMSGYNFLPNVNYVNDLTISSLNFTGSLFFDASTFANPANAQFFITSTTPTINFTNVTMTYSAGVNPANIFWLTKTGSINFSSTSSVPPSPPIYGNIISAADVTFDANSTNIIGNIFNFGGGVSFAGTTSVNGAGGPVCYLKGSKILTQNGYTKVEDLNVGDLVVTKGKIHENQYIDVDEPYTLEPVTWVGSFRPANLNSKSLPICIKAGAFGENMPFEDLFISPGHRVIVDGKMVLVSELINGETIFQDCSIQDVEYYHLELASHSSIVANGVLSETYLDLDTRYVFSNKKEITSTPIVPLVETIMV